MFTTAELLVKNQKHYRRYTSKILCDVDILLSNNMLINALRCIQSDFDSPQDYLSCFLIKPQLVHSSK